MDDSAPEDGFLVGGPVSRLSVSLRVAGDALDPVEITRLLGVAPKFAARKGEQIPRGPRYVTQRIGIWTFDLLEDPSPEWELDDAIQALLARLPADLDVWRSLAAQFQLDVFCGLFMGDDNQGAELRPETLRTLGERGVKLSLDVYGPPPDDPAT